jgi:hypothetical protein
MRLAWHIACMGIRGMHIGLWRERQNERDNYEDLDVMVLRWILEK